MKKKRRLFLILAAFLLLGGCRISDVEKGEREAVEYTVLRADAIPPEVSEIIREQGEEAFQMTYASSGYLYILRGYGRQKSGGYSIRVEEVTSTEEALHVRTRLLGPETEEEQKGDGSIPYLVIKTENLELPVIFE